MTPVAWTVLWAVTLGAPPAPLPPAGRVAVVLVGRSGLSAPDANALADRIASRLQAGALEVAVTPSAAKRKAAAAGISDPASCEGKGACARDLGSLLEASVVVAVELGALRKTVAVHLEAIAVADGERLAQHDFSLARGARAAIPDLQGFVDAVQSAVAQRERQRADAPVAAAVAASPPPGASGLLPPGNVTAASPPGVAAATAKSSSSAPVWVSGGLAVATGVTAVTFAALGLSAKGQLGYGTTPDGRAVVTVPEERARQLASTANSDFTVSAVAGGACAALTGLAAYWLLRD